MHQFPTMDTHPIKRIYRALKFYSLTIFIINHISFPEPACYGLPIIYSDLRLATKSSKRIRYICIPPHQ